MPPPVLQLLAGLILMRCLTIAFPLSRAAKSNRVIGTLARLNSSIPSAVGLVHWPWGPVWCGRVVVGLRLR
jgi:hypothetical protein